MMIYRSLVVGLLGAIALLLAEQGSILERSARPRAASVVALPPPRAPAWTSPPASPLAYDERGPATIVHISRARAGDDPRPALGIGAREHAIAIDDVAVDDHGDARLRARWRQARAGSYVELLIAGDSVRRMLVLVTP